MSSFNVPDTSVGFLHPKLSVEFVLLEDVLDATMMSDNESLLIALVSIIYLVLRYTFSTFQQKKNFSTFQMLCRVRVWLDEENA